MSPVNRLRFSARPKQSDPSPFLSFFFFPIIKLSKIWNASRICVSSLRRGHANLLCIVPILVYVPPKLVQYHMARFYLYCVRSRRPPSEVSLSDPTSFLEERKFSFTTRYFLAYRFALSFSLISVLLTLGLFRITLDDSIGGRLDSIRFDSIRFDSILFYSTNKAS